MKLLGNEVIYESGYKQLSDEEAKEIDMKELEQRMSKETKGNNWKFAWLSNRLREVKI